MTAKENKYKKGKNKQEFDYFNFLKNLKEFPWSSFINELLPLFSGLFNKKVNSSKSPMPFISPKSPSKKFKSDNKTIVATSPIPIQYILFLLIFILLIYETML